ARQPADRPCLRNPDGAGRRAHRLAAVVRHARQDALSRNHLHPAIPAVVGFRRRVGGGRRRHRRLGLCGVAAAARGAGDHGRRIVSNLELGLWSFPALLVLIFLRMPIGLAMLLCGLAGTWMVMGTSAPILSRLKVETYSTFSSYSLSIVPLFLLMGQFASLGGMSQSLFRAANAFLGHRRGGVAMSAIGACAGFGAICGSSLATAATMSQVALPELRRYGYSGALATGTLAAGGTLGVLIPPSVVLVLYAILAEQNIAKLFVAAFIPGVLAAIGYMIAISIYVRLNP